MIGLRWSLRLVGVASIAVLARLLTPGDFGTIAFAMLFVGIVEAFGDTGERLALIRQASLDRSYYDTAFLLQIMIGVVVALAIFFLAPITMMYFHDPRAVNVMRFLALRAILSGLENIGTVDFRRDMRFGAMYSLTIRAKLISIAATILLAIWLRNYWALAIGIVTYQAAITVLSYTMHPYRPRLSLARWNEISKFSGWTLLRSTGLYLTSQIDQFAVGGFGSATAMGRYAVASDVAASPTAEINEPVVAVLYPVMSRCRQNKTAIHALFARAFGWTVVVCIATSVGTAAIARDYCLLILGPQWEETAALVPWLALSAGLLAISRAADTVFDALGTPHIGARLQWIQLSLLMAAVTPVAILAPYPEAVAIARLGVSCIFMPIALFSVGRTISMSFQDYLAAAWRPVAAASLMAGVVTNSIILLPTAPYIRLLVEVPLGALTYSGTMLLLWHVAGRPAGPERDLLGMGRTLRASALRVRASMRDEKL
jgi:O-antigen/teichoic acid export membrane protein